MKLLFYVISFIATIFGSGKIAATSFDDNLMLAIKQNRKEYTDSVRAIMIVTSSMYEEPSSSEADYIMLFSFLLHSDTEEYSEGIDYNLYSMFTSFPNKFNQLNNYLIQVSPYYKTLILYSLIYRIVGAYYLWHDENISYESFCNQFPFLCEDETYRTIVHELILNMMSGTAPDYICGFKN